ncbi:TIM barrel protein [Helicovermis profundi]|uniref:Xylose isomerase-like TIM barrel domain-containing protein n=1 Tax=Helicovermis profundi TaxID=3065157 RepID=A0AAU9ENS0_9FIRM|nr:hypothetical protein HLPR_21050 [Clostridia bacterium S502]
MNTFITLDEKIFNGIEFSNFLSIFDLRIIKGFEIAPHNSLLEEKKYLSLAKKIYTNKQNINFHVPNFLKSYNFELCDFIKDTTIKDNYKTLFKLIYNMIESSNKVPTLTFHGAKSIVESEQGHLKDDTYFFIDWALNYFEKNKIKIDLSFELTSKKDISFGSNREDILSTINDFDTSSFGICWDLTHDYLNNYDTYLNPSKNFVEKINNVHIHGFGKAPDSEIKTKHIPLNKSEINFDSQIKLLKDYNYSNAICNELLYGKTNNFIEDNLKDIALINKLLR